jgi:predicted ABC-type sugar transport system permease subunit
MAGAATLAFGGSIGNDGVLGFPVAYIFVIVLVIVVVVWAMVMRTRKP